LFRGHVDFLRNDFRLDEVSEKLYGVNLGTEIGRMGTFGGYAAFNARADFNLGEEREHPLVFGQSSLVLGVNVPLLPLKSVLISASGGPCMLANAFQLQEGDYQWQYGGGARLNLNVKTRFALLQGGYHRVFKGISPEQNGNPENKLYSGNGWDVKIVLLKLPIPRVKANIGIGFGQEEISVPAGIVKASQWKLVLGF
jgi:hypothetical protein